MRHTLIIAASASMCVASAAHADTMPRIGTAAVATNAVSGTLGTSRRDLRRGDGVFQDERIATGDNSGAQLLFRDETALTMGPQSQVVLDKLIYDPNKRTGEMTIRAMTGAFRFVSGSGPKQGYKIETPVGTIGVRGTIIQLWVTPGRVTLQLDEGGALFCAGARCVGLDKPGTYLVATAQNVGNPQPKECGASSGSTTCQITRTDDTLLLQFLDRRTFNDAPSAAAVVLPPPPAESPPPAPVPVPQTKFGVPFPPEIANRAFGVPLPPTASPPPPPPLSATPQTKYGVPLPAAIANRVYK